MNDQNRRSALQVVADAARKIKAAARIMRAALAGGLHGAAIAAAKEALPTIVKFAVGFVIAVVVIPMFVISAMPNMFFGYETSEKDPQITMREQALSIGGAYLSLEDFEKTQQDAIITGEAAAYENQGVTIDEIRVSSKFDEEDLCWYIAINSVAHKQDLSEMKPEEVQSLLISNLKHTTRLESSGNQTVLRIIFQPLDKDKLMDDLEFDEDAQAHCLKRSTKATRLTNTKINLKHTSQITRAIPAIPVRRNPPLAAVVAEAVRRAAAAPTTPLISPVLQIRAQKTTMISPPMRYRRGNTVGGMCGGRLEPS